MLEIPPRLNALKALLAHANLPWNMRAIRLARHGINPDKSPLRHGQPRLKTA